MYRTLNIHYAETVQKDVMIESLKRQLQSLKERQHDYDILQNQVAKIQAKYQLIKTQKQRIEKQNLNKLEINQQFILELKTQADNLRLESSKLIAKMQPLVREIYHKQRIVQDKQSEITALTRINLRTSQDNLKMLEQNKILTNRVSQIQTQRFKLENQKQSLSKSLQTRLAQQKVFQQQFVQFQESNKKLLNILSVAEKDNFELDEQTKIRQATLTLLFKKLENINAQAQNIFHKINQLKQQVKRGQQDLLSIKTDFDLLTIKNKQNVDKIAVYESQLKLLQTDYQTAIIQKENLSKEQITSSLQNKTLQTELAQILLTIAHAEKQHIYLQQQCVNYLADSQQANKKLLGRKQQTKNILNEVNQGLYQTSYFISHLR